jgi:hypothetical protein
LVALTFIGEPSGLEIDHIDRNGLNNNVNNLRYVTNKENCNNRCTGYNRGEKNGITKLTEVEVIEIRRSYEEDNITQAAIAKIYGVHPDTISCIILRKTWSYLK